LRSATGYLSIISDCVELEKMPVSSVKTSKGSYLSIFLFQLSTKYAGMVELADTLDLGAVTSVKVFGESIYMKWKEMSAFHKVVAVIGILCGVVYFSLFILELTRVLSNLYTVARIFSSILSLCLGVLGLKSQRNLAIFWLIFGGSGLLLSVIYLFI